MTFGGCCGTLPGGDGRKGTGRGGTGGISRGEGSDKNVMVSTAWAVDACKVCGWMIGFSGRLPLTELFVSGGEMGFGVAFFECLRGSMVMARRGRSVRQNPAGGREYIQCSRGGDIRRFEHYPHEENSRQSAYPGSKTQIYVQYPARTDETENSNRNTIAGVTWAKRLTPRYKIGDGSHAWMTHTTTDMGVERSRSNTQLEPAKY